jgi:hypothetical protein
MRIVPHIDESVDQVLKGIAQRLSKRRKSTSSVVNGDRDNEYKLDFEKRLRNRRKRTGDPKSRGKK